MRQIKFRALTVLNQWVYGTPCESTDGIMMVSKIHHIDGAEYNVDERLVRPETVGQFTGLKDKNGKEIYEGDVVTGHTRYERDSDDVEWTREHPAIVEWRTEEAGFYPFTMNNRWRCDVKNIEVIGNIYENPELLK
jgi:uncharacterized phage protein (TIGR01671 family)